MRSSSGTGASWQYCSIWKIQASRDSFLWPVNGDGHSGLMWGAWARMGAGAGIAGGKAPIWAFCCTMVWFCWVMVSLCWFTWVCNVWSCRCSAVKASSKFWGWAMLSRFSGSGSGLSGALKNSCWLGESGVGLLEFQVSSGSRVWCVARVWWSSWIRWILWVGVVWEGLRALL